MIILYPLYRRRIIVEGNPMWRKGMITHNPGSDTFAANVAICQDQGWVHYLTTPRSVSTSGIAEFMSDKFFGMFHHYLAGYYKRRGNRSSIDWDRAMTENLKHGARIDLVACVPLTDVIRETKQNHIHAFILDVVRYYKLADFSL